jgi:TonB family protein
MAIQVKRFLMIGLLAIATGAVMTSSGVAAEPDATRKVTKKVTPIYPQLARKMLLSGTVRLAAMVAPAGDVKSTEVIGGHPILAAAAAEAAMQWRYQAAERESRELLVFTFAPQ